VVTRECKEFLGKRKRDKIRKRGKGTAQEKDVAGSPKLGGRRPKAWLEKKEERERAPSPRKRFERDTFTGNQRGSRKAKEEQRRRRGGRTAGKPTRKMRLQRDEE